MKRLCVCLAVLASVPLLGSCALFSPKTMDKQSRNWVPDEREQTEYAASQMAMGREALQLNQYGLAIISFRNVLRFPEHQAAASNGLGVAFAALGRPDLARRYFLEAVKADPEDRRFAANLARLDVEQARQQLAARSSGERVSEPAEQGKRQETAGAARSANALGPRITIQQHTNSLVRNSVTSVTIATFHPAAASQAVSPRRVPVASAAADGRRRNPQYPVRVFIGPKPAVAVNTGRAGK